MLLFAALLLLLLLRQRRLRVSDADAIDAVVTWVDGSDPAWLASKREHLVQQRDDDWERFTPAGSPTVEVDLVLDLLRRNMPWLRKVFVVTHRPQRVPSRHDVVHVHHDQIWERSAELPVFNSHAVEANLHRIPGLADRFLYLNDDFFVTAPSAPEDWFDASGRPYVRSSWSAGYDAMGRKDHSAHMLAWKRLAGYFRRPVRYLKHAPYAMTRQVCQRAEAFFGDSWRKTSASRERAYTDIPPVGAALNLALHEGAATLRDDDIGNAYSYGDVTQEWLRANAGAKTVCLNSPRPETLRRSVDAIRSFAQ